MESTGSFECEGVLRTGLKALTLQSSDDDDDDDDDDDSFSHKTCSFKCYIHVYLLH